MQNIDSILSQMTLEEKAALCTGATNWKTVAVERLDLPAMFVSDGPHGLRKVENEGLGAKSLPATCFPTASSTASSWDVELLYQMGQAIAEEAIALGVDVVLGPGANMKRTPLCGRNFEYFSEVPYVAGQLLRFQAGRGASGQIYRRGAEQRGGHFPQALRCQQSGVPAFLDQCRSR